MENLTKEQEYWKKLKEEQGVLDPEEYQKIYFRKFREVKNNGS